MADKPKIGITVSPRRGEPYYLPYRKAVEAAGAEPVELPPGTRSLPDVDGLLLPGGWDVDPAFYGENIGGGLAAVVIGTMAGGIAGIVPCVHVRLLDFFERRHQNFGDKAASIGTEMAALIWF